MKGDLFPWPADWPARSLGGLHMRRYRPDELVDAVVIGTGAGGSPLLARAGLRVVAIEAGSFAVPSKYASDEVV